MLSDEQSIRDLIAQWMQAAAVGDTKKLNSMMAEDVVFLQPGLPPMRGRNAFQASFAKALEKFKIDGTSEIQEIKIIGEWAYCWNHLKVTMTPRESHSGQGGEPMRRSGYTLTVLQKEPQGWVIFRDANLLTEA